MTRAVGYLRVSGRGQAGEEHYSLPDQAEKVEEYCHQHGYSLVATFTEVHSGGDLWGRPELNDLLAMARRKEFDVLVAIRFDRLAREINHQGYIISQLERYKIQIECTKESFDNSSQGKMLRMLVGMFAEIERHRIRDRTNDGLRRRILSGAMRPGSRPLYGYCWRDERKTGYEIHPVSSRVVRRIFDETMAGRSLIQVVVMLMGEGVLAPSDFWRRECGLPLKGASWHPSTVRRILMHPAYWGEMAAYRYYHHHVEVTDEFGRTKSLLRQERRADGDPELVALPDVAPAIVPREIAMEAVQRLAANQLASARNNHAPEETLLRGGLVRCAICGHTMHVIHKKGHTEASGRTHQPVTVYRCTRPSRGRTGCMGASITASALDGLVWGWVCDTLDNPDIWARQVEQKMGQGTTQTDRVATVSAHIEDLERQRAQVSKVIARLEGEDEDVVAPLVLELRELAQRKRQATEDLAGLQQLQSNWQATKMRLNDLGLWMRGVSSHLGTLGYQDRRMVLSVMLTYVRVFPPGHEPRVEIQTPYTDGDCITISTFIATQLERLEAWLALRPPQPAGTSPCTP